VRRIRAARACSRDARSGARPRYRWPSDRRFRPEDLDLLRSLAAQATTALGSVAPRGRSTQAVNDGLICLANHRFKGALASEMERIRRHGLPVGLFVLDFDDFKQANDAFGHRRRRWCSGSSRAYCARPRARPSGGPIWRRGAGADPAAHGSGGSYQSSSGSDRIESRRLRCSMPRRTARHTRSRRRCDHRRECRSFDRRYRCGVRRGQAPRQEPRDSSQPSCNECDR
jgi:hypothetical protein